jgi:hypothetical protein
LLLEPPQRISARLLKCLPAPRTQDHFLSLKPSVNVRGRCDRNVNAPNTRSVPATCRSSRKLTTGLPCARTPGARPTTGRNLGAPPGASPTSTAP